MCVAGMVDVHDKRHMPQTSANVFKGHSGGMLLTEAGELAGMVTSNAKRSDGTIVSSVSFALPAACIAKVFGQVQSIAGSQPATGDAGPFVEVDVHDDELGELWDMHVNEMDEYGVLAHVHVGDAPPPRSRL